MQVETASCKPMDSPAEKEHRLKDVANAAHIVFSAVRRSETDTAVLHTPYGKSTVHIDGEGADIELPQGATVHVRFGSEQ